MAYNNYCCTLILFSSNVNTNHLLVLVYLYLLQMQYYRFLIEMKKKSIFNF